MNKDTMYQVWNQYLSSNIKLLISYRARKITHANISVKFTKNMVILNKVDINSIPVFRNDQNFIKAKTSSQLTNNNHYLFTDVIVSRF